MNSDQLFKKSVELDNEIYGNKHEATILFADLVGSTAFKTDTDIVNGLKKTYIHNALITEIVEKCGEVVKYIGDEVMAIFKSEDHPKDACQAAIEIQTAIADINEQHHKSPILPIQSKIGIHSGQILYWKYSAQKNIDPQGTTVDYAARLVSLANGNQIICSNETFKILSDQSDFNFSEPTNVFLKGFSDHRTVFEVIHEDLPKGINPQPLKLSDNEDLRKAVRDGIVALERGKIELAEQIFSKITQENPLDFIANCYYGILLSRYKHQPEKALEYFKKAYKTNPNEPLSCLFLGYLVWFINKERMTKEELQSAIFYTEKCLSLTETKFDYTNRRNAKANLAFFYKQRNEGDDLDNAIKLCEEVKRHYKIVENQCYAGFLDTYAEVLIQKSGKEALGMARDLLMKVFDIDPKFPYAHENMAKLIRAEQKLGIAKEEGPIY